MTLTDDPDQGTRLTHYSATDTGKARAGNEDGHYDGIVVFAVADGMGGHAAGEIASAMALEPVQRIDSRTWPTTAQAVRALTDAVREANHDVVAKAASDRSLRGMGTTLTAALVREGKLHVVHVGDSRAYLLRAGEGLRQLTTDHTLVEQLVREGRIEREEIPTHPQRSVITRAIGVEPTVQVDTLDPLELVPGDQILLCSDGLTGPVGEEEITRLLHDTRDGREACRRLVAAANREGGPDNITVVLLRVEPAGPDERVGDLPPGAEGDGAGGADTAELAPMRSSTEGPVVEIRTRDDRPADFDAAALGHMASRQGAQPAPGLDDDPAPRRGRQVLAAIFGLLVIIAILVGGGSFLLSRSFYVGVDEEGLVTVYRGLPQEVAGIALGRAQERTEVLAADLPEVRRRALEQGITEPSLRDARTTVENLRAEALDAADVPAATPAPGAPGSAVPGATPDATEPGAVPPAIPADPASPGT